jgi:hypothetical protein
MESAHLLFLIKFSVYSVYRKVQQWLWLWLLVFISSLVELNFYFSDSNFFFQEKLHRRKCSEDVEDSGRVREWLELQIRSTEFDVVKNALWRNIEKVKANTNHSDLHILPLQEEETKGISKEVVSIIIVLRLWRREEHRLRVFENRVLRRI